MSNIESIYISTELKERILENYPSRALRNCLNDGDFNAIAILTKLVYLNFNANRILVLAQNSNTKAIAKLCKEHLDGISLIGELQRELFSIKLH